MKTIQAKRITHTQEVEILSDADKIFPSGMSGGRIEMD